jgi:hypothetical protein
MIRRAWKAIGPLGQGLFFGVGIVAFVLLVPPPLLWLAAKWAHLWGVMP